MKKICIVAGEPNSINSEIIIKSWNKINKSIKKNIFIIGNASLLTAQFKKLNIKIKITKINNINFFNSSKKLCVFNIPLNFKNPYLINKKQNSKFVLECLNVAHKLSMHNKIHGFINCSIDKKIFNNRYKGVTEFLAKKNKTKIENMLIYNEKVSVSPITTHIKVANISKTLNKKMIVKKINSLSLNYFKVFKKKPSIEVLGLNPHNSELRDLSEENKIIIPSIKYLKQKKINIFGPFSADTIFLKKNIFKYDVIVGMYHDQVLAPFKALYNLNAINITFGLNYLRVSPDHGTAVDLIGKNSANPQSLIKSIKFLNDH